MFCTKFNVINLLLIIIINFLCVLVSLVYKGKCLVGWLLAIRCLVSLLHCRCVFLQDQSYGHYSVALQICS